MSAYYNENNPKMAVWLRALMAARLIGEGDIDERDIRTVSADDLRGYRRCHFFAGIAGWDLALQYAGWPDDREVWTGSSPCQFGSSAARGRTVAADLWRPFLALVAARRPGVVLGEQVIKDWWADRCVRDLESMGYAVGAVVLPAWSVGCDHTRARFYFVGHANGHRESGMRVDAKAFRVPRNRGLTGGLVSPDGLPSRVDQLSGFGNAIVPQVAAEFIRAYMDIRP